MFNVKGKVAVITGGSRGLGLAIGREFLIAGADKVVLVSRKQDACDKAAAELNNEHLGSGRADGLGVDLGAPDGGKKLKESLTNKLGLTKLDILVANAGATWGADFASHPPGAIDKVLNLNVRGVFLSIQALEPMLSASATKEDPSRVIITGSVAGLRAGLSGGTYGYLASKAAVHHLAKSLSVELGPEKITVNVIAPGFVPTKMSNGLLEVIGEEMRDSTPLRRLGKPEDVGLAAVYLCSPAASFVNGVVLPVDGGIHLAGRL